MTRSFALTWLGLLPILSGCGVGVLVGGAAASSSNSKRSKVPLAPTTELLSISPAQGPVHGGERVLLLGRQFSLVAGQKPVVTFGGLAGEDVVVLDTERLEVTTPRHEHISTVGPVDVMVIDPLGGTSTLPAGFRYTDAPPAVTVSVPSAAQSGNVVVTITLSDPESELIDLMVEISSGAGWETIPPARLTGALSGLTTTPAGVIHFLTWDSLTRFPAANASGLRLRVTPVDRGHLVEAAGEPATSGQFSIVNNGRPTLSLTQPGDDAYDVALAYRLLDPDAGNTLVVTTASWEDLHRGTSGSLTLKQGDPSVLPGVVSSSPSGVTHQLVWDSFADLGFGNDRLVRVSLAVTDGADTVSAVSEPFFVHNGPLDHGRSLALSGDTILALRDLAAGDLNGDGLTDMAVSGGRSIGVRWNNGTNFSPLFSKGLLGVTRASSEDLRWDGTLNVTRQGGSPTALQAGQWIGLGPAGDPIGARFFRVASVAGATAVISDPYGYQALGLLPGAPALGGAVSGAGLTLQAGGDGAGSAQLAPDFNPGALAILSVDENLATPAPVVSDLVVVNQVPPLRQAALASAASAGATSMTLVSAAPDQRSLEAGRLVLIGNPAGVSEQVRLTAIDVTTGVAQFAPPLAQAWPAATPVLALDSSAYFLSAGHAANHSFTVVPGGLGPLGQATTSTPTGGFFPQHALAADVVGPGGAAPDGLQDLVIVNALSPADPTRGRVSVFPRLLAGGFAAPVLLDVGLGAGAGAGSVHASVADVTSNGLPDLVVANRLESSVSLLLQGPPGTFTHQAINLGAFGLPAGDVESVALADLDQDGRIDLIVCGALSQRLYLLRGADPDGAGPLVSLPGGDATAPFLIVAQTPSPPALVAGAPTTQPAGTLFTDLLPTRVSVGDLNDDGRPDLLLAGQGSNDARMFLNLGSSGPVLQFASVRATTGLRPTRVVNTDLSGDGRQDLLVLDTFSPDVHQFLQTTRGTLDHFRAVPVGQDPLSVAIGELGSQWPGREVVVTNGADHSISVLGIDGHHQDLVSIAPSALGLSLEVHPASRVQPTPPVAEVRTLVPLSPSIGDLNGDGLGDVAVSMQVFVPSSPLTGAVNLLYNRGGSTPIQSTDLVLQTQPNTLFQAIGDVVGGPANDLLVANIDGPSGLPDSGTLQVFQGDGAGGFSAVAQFAIPSPIGIRVVDLDGDGDLDVVVAQGRTPATGSNFSVLVQEPKGTLQAPVDGVPGGIPSALSPNALSFIATGDLNADGLVDVAFMDFTDGKLGVAFQASPATTPPTFPTLQPLLAQGRGLVATGDVNGDGLSDLVASVIDDNRVAIYLQRPGAGKQASASLAAPYFLDTGPGPYGIAIGDVDGDGRSDLVVTSRGSSSLNVFFQR